MKKYYLITIVAVLLSAVATSAFVSSGSIKNLKMVMAGSVVAFSQDDKDNNTDTEEPGSGVIVTCHCNALIGHTCRANHNGRTCAVGVNVQCSGYDGNC